ncbi:DUF1853 family protein [Gilvibacter sp.]|uniref:DUF1853 family protein n=1 Tax=Gilvibacter sp. TaxID=2729997 RepID=UPI003B518209
MSVQLQFSGYLDTPPLWEGSGPMGLEQLHLSTLETPIFQQELSDKLRLGNLVERFVAAELTAHKHIEILAENVQIQQEKRTLGELDCLLRIGREALHLEVIYKFYLYDPAHGITPLDHWIGPNRRDSLVLKLNKLAEKQLPLLHRPETASYLQALDLEVNNMSQKVCFKAQLFLPYSQKDLDVSPLSRRSIYGYYLPLTDFHLFKDCKCYIPRKHDWLVSPHPQVTWLSFKQAYERIEIFNLEQSAPLVWIKDPKGTISKIFVVWW